ncbi:uncharacterized protein RCC_04915 [Ramularia collo-cygni]|uniref:PBP domain-containing protein n=1 Tax=Ramularia collo-cygni TaxID=112498 RepID=A0A2D3VBU1_9PEZI|nr:uncharacterized protein RCC_04915 [Ramularia collo-cygni]CZT19069.1 uncharacterized protein RCC_04915 [Ramularia collo-cygni]
MELHQDDGLANHVHVSNPWLSRYFNSQLLLQHGTSSDTISTQDKEVYGNPSHPIRFRIGNGGAGYTGILKLLAETYIKESGSGIRIAWVSNHSRHSQVALLAGVVQIALTYEPRNEDISIHEHWAERVCRPFNDHFIFAGPDVDLHARDIEDAFRIIANSHSQKNGKCFPFHSRGDGSATFAKEQTLWKRAGIDVIAADWIETYPLVPYDALRKAEEKGAFLLTDRSTYLTAKRDGGIPSLRVHVEGGAELMNPCSALVGSTALVNRIGDVVESHAAARAFAEWLGGDRAQEIACRYGMEWPVGKALFTRGDKDDFDELDHLVHRC